MLGRVRPLSSSSSSSLDSLERPSPKIIKHDSLSIYEATIMKLKLASQRDISSIQEEAMTIETDATSASVSASSQNELSLPSMEAIEMETSKQTNCSASVSKSYQHYPSSSYEEAMTIDATGLSPGCSDCQSMINSVKQQRNRNLSIADLFSKYKSSQHAQSSAYEETM
ncbi:uncharacterized protein LOC117904875 [Vitis riparia]|uniref:uncharacterized protein LOC117904875 n=1 Tax=Vitis riparia TaxID=96939 RepID=UPI00155A571F|nr:uncharacterized protein LOC117904875 [Vitis riparia]